MIKYVWHVAALMIVFCWTMEQSAARSANANSYQHLNNLAASKSKQETISDDSLLKNSPNFWKDISLLYRIYQQCIGDNLTVCLKVKLLTGMEKVLRQSKSLKVIDGIQFVSNGAGVDAAAKIPLNEKDIEAVLPRTADAKDQMLNGMIIKRLSNFLQDHTLQVKFPDLRAADDQSANDNSVESRKKKEKKGHGAMIMIPLLLGGTIVPIAYGALAMLAGKALIVSKLALVLASIIGIKKLLSGGGGKESSHEVVVSGGSHSGWGRDFDVAYNGWKPAKESHSIKRSL